MFRLLIADDEHETRNVVEMAMKNAFPDIEIFHARDGREIDRVLEREEIDIIILDLMMPYSNAIEVVRKCKTGSKQKKVLIYTGVHDLEVCKQFIKIGADDFILKPFSLSEITEVVSRLMNQKDQTKETLDRLRKDLKKLTNGLRED